MADKAEKEFVAVNVAVLTISSTRTFAEDTSGQLIADYLTEAGHVVAARAIVKDRYKEMQLQMMQWVHDPSIDVIISTGGTGVTQDDLTPEVIKSIATREIPGFGELFRWLSFDEIGTSTIQSRALAALIQGTFVFALPGSNGAVRLGMSKILIPQLDIRHRPCNFTELLSRVRPSQKTS